jgi:hypothetical protein
MNRPYDLVSIKYLHDNALLTGSLALLSVELFSNGEDGAQFYGPLPYSVNSSQISPRDIAYLQKGVILVILIILLLPETSLTLKAQQAASLGQSPAEPESKARSPTLIAKRIVTSTFTYTVKPLFTINKLAIPQIGLAAAYASICFGGLYAISVSTPFMFAKAPYRLHSLDISLLYLPACVGYALGSIAGGYLSDAEVRRAKARDGDNYAPEVRLRSARWGIPLVPAGLLIFGWGLHRHTRLALPITGSFIFGVGLMLTNGTVSAL